MQDTIAAVVLAGGMARRMGGRDKALVPYRGMPLIEHVLNRLRPQVGNIVISANGDAGRFRHLGLPVAADDHPGEGPLAGILAAAAFCRGAWPHCTHMVSVPVDAPFLPENLVARLATAQAPGGQTAAMTAASKERAHWTVTLWPLAGMAAVDWAFNDQGLRRLEGAAGLLKGQLVMFEDEQAFANINFLPEREEGLDDLS